MTPGGMQALGWEAARSLSPELVLASLLGLIVLVKLLAICSQCNRDGFELDKSSQVQRSPSTLIKVIEMEDAAISRENPCFQYKGKDEQVPSPSTENGSLHVSVRSGDVWYTPWKSHSRTLSRQERLSYVLNHEANAAASASEPPANSLPRIPVPSGAAVIPHQEEGKRLPPADAGMERPRPVGRPEPREAYPESSAHALRQKQLREQHTYESLEDMEAAIAAETEGSGYQTVAEVNAWGPGPLDRGREAGPELPPALARIAGMEMNGMYAQVSRKCKSPTQLPLSLSEGAEPAPSPRPQLVDEEEPAPPLPDRHFEM